MNRVSDVIRPEVVEASMLVVDILLARLILITLLLHLFGSGFRPGCTFVWSLSLSRVLDGVLS